jgi:hypothetical protein
MTRIAYRAHSAAEFVSEASRDESPVAFPALASLIIVLTVAMQRPQFRRQPRHS